MKHRVQPDSSTLDRISGTQSNSKTMHDTKILMQKNTIISYVIYIMLICPFSPVSTPL